MLCNATVVCKYDMLYTMRARARARVSLTDAHSLKRSAGPGVSSRRSAFRDANKTVSPFAQLRNDDST